MRPRLKLAGCLSGMLIPMLAHAGQQANQSSIKPQPSAAQPKLRLFRDAQSYSWGQVFYGPMPRPHRMSSLERRARHTSDVLGRGIGFAVFEDKTFGEILDEFFAVQHGLEVTVDWDALASCSANVTPDTKVYLNVRHTAVD